MALSFVLAFTVACQPPPPAGVAKETVTPAASVQSDPEGKDAAYFARQMTDLSRWARYLPTEKSVLRSSHSGNQFDTREGAQAKSYVLDGTPWFTLLDESGPGCITRFWLSDSAQGNICFYFDDEAQPRLNMDIQDFFSKWMVNVAPQLIQSTTVTGCGQVSYLPIPFQKRCTVLCSSNNPDIRYQFNILKLPANENVISFPAEPNRRILDALKAASDFLSTTAVNTYYARKDKQEVVATLKPNESQMLLNLPGPAAINYFEIQMKKMTMEEITNLDIEIYWDGMDSPGVQCSLRQFFCNNDFQRNWNSLPMGYITNASTTFLYSQFFMPFKEKTQIFMKNRNNVPTELAFRYHVDIDPQKISDDPLYFYARANQQTHFTGLLYPTIEFEGAGNFVGMNWIGYTESKLSQFLFLGGDEYVFVDGEPDPSLAGTGIDDSFNMDNRLSTTNYCWFPLHGCLGKIDSSNEQNGEKIFQTGCNLYRFQLLDAIPFRTSFMRVQEIGDPIQFNTLSPPDPGNKTVCTWVCYWYGKQETQRVERKERAYYFRVSDTENDAPDTTCPIMIGSNLHIQLPKGLWWIHYAPVWNLNDVQHVTKEIQ